MQNKNRVIFHIDCNSYYASVEEIFQPELKTKPMAIAGNPAFRAGIILAKNQKAQKFGVKTAETIWEAKRKCPNLVLVPPRHKVYYEYSKKINAIYEEYTGRVERLGIDESYLDVTQTLRERNFRPWQLANIIRLRIKEEISLTVSVGVSYNKVFAKFASDYRKPDAITIITPKNYKEIVWPSPVGSLLFVGKVTEKHLIDMKIKTIGDLANYPFSILRKKFGKLGERIYFFANGIDDDEVASIHDVYMPQSIGKGHTFPEDLSELDDLKREFLKLSKSVSERIKRKKMQCQTVQITIKDPRFQIIQRQKSFKTPIDCEKTIFEKAVLILKTYWKIGDPIRMLTVTASNLTPIENRFEQLSFF